MRAGAWDERPTLAGHVERHVVKRGDGNEYRRKNRDVMLDRRRADPGDDSVVIMGTIVARRGWRVAVAWRRCQVGNMKAARVARRTYDGREHDREQHDASERRANH